MAARSGDVSGYVSEVIAAFEKAVKLVQKIEVRDAGNVNAQETSDLRESLALGPVIVKGYYAADSRRLGSAYTIGDYEAQVQMRDVLLSLKSLVGDLSDILIDEKEMDFAKLLYASDESRGSAGVCLGQLAQRLGDQKRLHVPMMQQSLGGPGLDYSTSRSTHSSGERIPRTPDTQYNQYLGKSDQNESYRHHRDDESSTRNSDGNWSGTSQLFTGRDIDELSLRRPSSTLLPAEDAMLISPVSQPHTGSFLPGQQDFLRDSYVPFLSHAGSPNSGGSEQSQFQRDRFGPDDFSPQMEQHGPYFPGHDSRQSVTSYASRMQSTDYSDLELVADLRQVSITEPLRLPARDTSLRQGSQQRIPSHIDGYRIPVPPRSEARSQPGFPSPSRSIPTPYTPTHPSQPQGGNQFQKFQRTLSNPDPIQYSHPHFTQREQSLPTPKSYQQPHQAPLVTDPTSAIPSVVTPSSFNNTHLSAHSYSQRRLHSLTQPSPLESRSDNSLLARSDSVASTAISMISNLPLTLPTEKDPGIFCKAGFRLFLGNTKKTFSIHNRPVQMTSFMPYWHCDKCRFEGPVALKPAVDKKGRRTDPEKVFDPTTRECGAISGAVTDPDGRGGEGSGGIRFKWVFLAKCHVPLKSQPDFGEMGSSLTTIGSFGCIFCVAEGSNRGWNTSGMRNDSSSMLSGANGVESKTPVFGSVQLFMDHLQMHRREEYWPCQEMRGRMKCVVGRTAEKGEDWEINFLPV